VVIPNRCPTYRRSLAENIAVLHWASAQIHLRNDVS
jgi:hypothetical protein